MAMAMSMAMLTPTLAMRSPYLSALTPPSPDPLCTLHLPFIPLTGSQTSDLGPNAWSNSTWFPKSPRAKSTLLSADLGPRTEEQLQLEQRCEVHGLHHGRGCRQELLLHSLRRAQLWFPHRRQVQSPDGQSDQGQNLRHPKIKLPHSSQTRSPGRCVCTQSLCLPHPHHCVKRKFMELQSTQAQQSRWTHS